MKTLEGNQRVIESSSWVSWVLGKWNLVSSAPFEMIGCLFHVFEPSYSWEHIHTIFWLAETPDTAKKDWTVLHCTPTGEQSHSEKNGSFCLTNSCGVNLWHSTTSARNGCKFKTMRLSEQTNKWNDGFNVSSSSQTWQWKITQKWDVFRGHLHLQIS